MLKYWFLFTIILAIFVLTDSVAQKIGPSDLTPYYWQMTENGVPAGQYLFKNVYSIKIVKEGKLISATYRFSVKNGIRLIIIRLDRKFDFTELAFKMTKISASEYVLTGYRTFDFHEHSRLINEHKDEAILKLKRISAPSGPLPG